MKRTLLAAIVLVALTAGAAAQNRARLADVELVGPLSGVILDAGRLGSTRIEGELLAGETRKMSVPVPVDSDASNAEPILRFDPGATGLEARGRVRFLGWSKGSPPLAPIPAGLRARALPALSEADVRTSRAAPLVLVAALVAALALRRKAWLALASAAVAAAILRALVSAPSLETEAAVTLLDGDGAGTAWRRVDAGIGEVAVPQEIESFELTSEPAGAPITWHIPLDPAAVWRARSPGARLFVTSLFAAGEQRLSRSNNRLATFDRTWMREEGEWSARGAWPSGAPLPEAATPGSPPGWLASNLPQGVPILIAREVPVPREPVVWVRVSALGP